MLESTRQRKASEASERIGGMDGALRFLDSLPEDMTRKVFLPALKAADRVGAAAAAVEAEDHADPRRRSGAHLYQTAGAAEAVRSTAVLGKVGYFGTAGGHGWLVEHGHRMVAGGTTERTNRRRHDFGKADRARQKERTGKGRIVGQVPPHPILAPAYEKALSRMIATAEQEVITRADRRMRSLAAEKGCLQ